MAFCHLILVSAICVVRPARSSAMIFVLTLLTFEHSIPASESRLLFIATR